MSQTIKLLNTRVEMSNALATPLVITGITKANPGVVTYTGVDPVNGDVVVLDVVGMDEMQGRAVRVSVVDGVANTFALEGVDTTAYGTFVSGTATPVSTWHTFTNSQNFSFPEPSAEKLPTTTIHDIGKQQEFGMTDPAIVSMNLRADPMETVMVALRKASLDKTAKVFRVTLQNGYKLIFNSYASGGRGIDGSAGGIATGKCELSLINIESWYAT